MERSEDITLYLNDPGTHAHRWRSVEINELGMHEVVCDCGATGFGFGEFETENK